MKSSWVKINLLIGLSLVVSCKNSTEIELENSSDLFHVEVYDPTQLSEKGDFMYDVGEMLEIQLTKGSKMSVGDKSFEYQLWQLLKNKDQKRTYWLTLDQIGFYANQFGLDKKAKKQLTHLSKILKQHSELTLTFGAFTAEQDVDKEKLQLILKEFTDFMVEQGIATHRIQVQVLGDQQRVCPPNDTAACQAQNRRFAVKIGN